MLDNAARHLRVSNLRLEVVTQVLVLAGARDVTDSLLLLETDPFERVHREQVDRDFRSAFECPIRTLVHVSELVK